MSPRPGALRAHAGPHGETRGVHRNAADWTDPARGLLPDFAFFQDASA